MASGDKLSPADISVVLTVTTITSSLSICGSLFIIVCFFAFKHLRKFSFKLVAILSATDIFNQVFDLLDPNATELADMDKQSGSANALCMTQAVGDNFFELASVMWTAAIAATLYVTVIWRWKLDDSWKTLMLYAAVCYGVPLVLTIAPAIDDAFGAAGGVCWIKNGKAYWRFISFYIPLWLVIGFNTFVYVRVLSLLHRTVRHVGLQDSTAQSIHNMMQRLSIYPFILVAVWLIDSINRIYEEASGRQSLPLLVIGSGMAGMQGMLNAFAYGFSRGVRDSIKETGRKVGLCKEAEASQRALVLDTDGVQVRQERVMEMQGKKTVSPAKHTQPVDAANIHVQI